MTNVGTLTASQTIWQRFTQSSSDENEHFALGLNIHKLVWIFTLGSVAGFFIESFFQLAKGTLEVRSSLIFGPFNIIYGVGAVVMFLALQKVNKQRKVHIALWGMFVGTVVEYVLAVAQEVIFGTISWDYSNLPFNIDGKICLYFTLAWGVISLLWVYAVNPFMDRLMLKLSDDKGRKIAVVLAVFLAINIAVSVLAVMRWQMRLDGTASLNQIGFMLDKYFPDDFMKIIYANMAGA